MPAPTDALHACLSSFSLLATANLQMDQLRRDGFKAALPPQYKGCTELLFGDLDKRMKDLDEKARPICNQAHPRPQSPPPPAVTRHIHLGMQPSVPIIVFLPPPRLQKTCVVSPQW